jgi:integrase
MGLGSASTVSLKQARDLAEGARAALARRQNPLSARDAHAQQFETFGECAIGYVDTNRHEWRNAKHVAQWTSTLSTYCGTIWDIPVDEVDTERVLRILRPIWNSKAETASRLRGRIERVLASAKVRGLRAGENPASWRGHLEDVLPARKKLTRGHHAALPYSDIPEFIAALRVRQAVAARALEFAILTASRSGEVLNARWSEIDLDARVWLVPAERMKAGRQHRVPLSNAASDLLNELGAEGRSEFVFPGAVNQRPLSSMAFSMILRRMKVPVTAHGFRSSFRDWAAEQTQHANEVAEMALAHVIRNASEAAYRRGDLLDKRRSLMEDWATFCGSLTIGANDVHSV